MWFEHSLLRGYIESSLGLSVTHKCLSYSRGTLPFPVFWNVIVMKVNHFLLKIKKFLPVKHNGSISGAESASMLFPVAIKLDETEHLVHHLAIQVHFS